ncbi:MAG: hypothetical protein HYS09_00300 [Chloroflexi bacterium]|nr:hypothetical protein [Chloroflexota bacterium]
MFLVGMQGVIEVNPSRLEALYTDGLELPYVEFGRAEPGIKLVLDGEEYWYYKTLPLKGYGAVLARQVRDLEAEGQKLLLARFWDRIYIYATGIKPIGVGKAPGV